jgi:regulator of protease activity HflC (stomatin/prohibitin superfamily)
MKVNKHLITAVLIAGLAMFATACSKVSAGNVGLKVRLLGSEKGVDALQVLGPGRYHIGMNEELHIFPTWQQNYVWTKNPSEGSPNDESFTMQTREGMEISCDIGITYHFEEAKIPSIFQKYRTGVNEITDKYLHNYVRDAMNAEASKMTVNEIYGEKKTQFMEQVQKAVKAQTDPEGIVVDKISLIGSFRLPESVVNALNAKNEAVQRAQQAENEVQRARAEADKAAAEADGRARSILVEANAQAKANRILAQSLTRALVEYKKVEKWNGQYPLVMTGNGNGLLIDTKGLADYKAPAVAAGTDKTAEAEQ